MSGMLVVAFGAVVLVPLGREYAEFRRAGLGRGASLGITSLVAPAFVIGLALSLPLTSRPTLQWTAIVLATLVVYSLAVRAIVASASTARTAPSRRT